MSLVLSVFRCPKMSLDVKRTRCVCLICSCYMSDIKNGKHEIAGLFERNLLAPCECFCKFSLTNSMKGVDQHQDDGVTHDAKKSNSSALRAEMHASTSLPLVVSSQHLLATYGTDGMLSQLQFKEASLEIFQCLVRMLIKSHAMAFLKKEKRTNSHAQTDSLFLIAFCNSILCCSETAWTVIAICYIML